MIITPPKELNKIQQFMGANIILQTIRSMVVFSKYLGIQKIFID